MDNGKKKVRNLRSEENEEEQEQEQVDRISRLSDDLIHHILSNVDAKDVMQTCLVSTRWRHIWRSLPHLNFNGCHFPKLPNFIKFVSRYLSSRSQQSHISVFNLNSAYCHKPFHRRDPKNLRRIQHSLIREIAIHTVNAQKVTITSNFSTRGGSRLPLSAFNSDSLKELCIDTNDLIATSIEGCSWNSSALTTLVFEGVTFVSCHDDGSGKPFDYFSSLVNLRHLSLTASKTLNSNIFLITSPRLETLTISKTLRYLDEAVRFVVSAPNLSSFTYSDHCLSNVIPSDGFPCLERANINIRDCPDNNKERVILEIIGLFHELRSAVTLTLAMDTLFLLSSAPKLLKNRTSPFRNLKTLKIVERKGKGLNRVTICRSAVTYLCNSSPSPTIINEWGDYYYYP